MEKRRQESQGSWTNRPSEDEEQSKGNGKPLHGYMALNMEPGYLQDILVMKSAKAAYLQTSCVLGGTD